MLALALALKFSGFGSEAPREAIIALGVWLFGLAVGAYLARRHIVKPAAERHEEVMAAHRAHARHGGYDLEVAE